MQEPLRSPEKLPDPTVVFGSKQLQVSYAFAPGADDHLIVFFDVLPYLARLNGRLFQALLILGSTSQRCEIPRSDRFHKAVCPNSYYASESSPIVQDACDISDVTFRDYNYLLQKAGLICPVSSLYINSVPCFPDSPRGYYMLNPFVVAHGKATGIEYARSLWINAVMRKPHDEKVREIALAATLTTPYLGNFRAGLELC